MITGRKGYRKSPLVWFIRLGHGQIEQVTRKIGNIPGPLSSGLFKMASPWKKAARWLAPRSAVN